MIVENDFMTQLVSYSSAFTVLVLCDKRCMLRKQDKSAYLLKQIPQNSERIMCKLE